MTTINQATYCWCGSEKLEPFSQHYARCLNCNTLVCQSFQPVQEDLRVKDDDHDFYGREYWLSHQTQDYRHPDIFQRTRNDLPERCLYWLSTLLKYKLPPGKSLELGSAHGGFVAMLQWAGFEATGLELSPWVVNFAQQTFNVPMVCGPVEDQQFNPASFDVIALMDVLEHLADPVATMQYCATLLKSDGLLLLQTPCYPENTSYADLVEQNDRFLMMLKEKEHLYLFSKQSARLLFQQLGLPEIVFESALFEYDMFFAVGCQTLTTHDQAAIADTLTTSPQGRLILTLLDLEIEKNRITDKWQEAETDRTARLEVIHQQGRQLGKLEAERNDLRNELTILHQYVETIETDRTVRLEQVNELARLLEESETDRAAQLEQIHQQGQELGKLKAERNHFRNELTDLHQYLGTIEADRVARLEVIHQQSQRLGETQARLDHALIERDDYLAKLDTLAQRRVYKLMRRLGKWDWLKLTENDQTVTENPPVNLTRSLETPLNETSYTFENYVATIEQFNKMRPDMVAVGEYNHQMIDTLNDLHPLKGRHLLDIGASPHGYALEWALRRGVASYTGIGLGIGETIEVQHQNRTGKLIQMNAENLTFDPETFDLIITLSTFEHFFNGDVVLQEMYRVLKPGGSVLVNFQPVWTSSHGHHLHHIPAVAKLIPPWAHLLWNEETMRHIYKDSWPANSHMSLEDAIEWIYNSNEINRVDVVTLRKIFSNSKFEIKWITPLLDNNADNKPIIADYLSKILPYTAEDLMTLGFSLLLDKK